jgi:hypothetical protein
MSRCVHCRPRGRQLRMDFTFIDDGHDTWGLGWLLTVRHVPGK